MSVKRVEAAKERVQAAYEKATRITDPGITFEETGIDYPFMDEAHHYKNLARTSDLGELACPGSNRATDLDFKLRALRERKTLSAERAGVATSTYLPAVATFATGTPVSNSVHRVQAQHAVLRVAEAEVLDVFDGVSRRGRRPRRRRESEEPLACSGHLSHPEPDDDRRAAALGELPPAWITGCRPGWALRSRSRSRVLSCPPGRQSWAGVRRPGVGAPVDLHPAHAPPVHGRHPQRCPLDLDHVPGFRDPAQLGHHEPAHGLVGAVIG